MPPTDCCDGAETNSALACAPELHDLGPASRSPLHHGTDPDLSAPTPLPPGVAATGLDLSPDGVGDAGARRSSAERRQALAKLKRKPRATLAAATSTPSAVFSSLPAAGTATQGQTDCTMTSEKVRRGGVCTPLYEHTMRDVGPHTDSSMQPADDMIPRPIAQDGNLDVDGCDDAPSALAPLKRSLSKDEDVGPKKSPDAKSVTHARGSSDGALGSSTVTSAATAKGGKDIKEMMARAKKVAANIHLLQHAKRCQGCTIEPGCEVARRLVAHMRGCNYARGGGTCKPTCVQAHRLLEHYAECSRKRALGGRCCLVCSLVARSATNGCPSGSNSSSRRQPLGHLSHSTRGTPGTGCGRPRNAPLPGSLHRQKGGEWEEGQGHGRGMLARQKDGVFFRPLPKARSGSWGGYDRRRLFRRGRFDSIPEDLAEEGEEDEELEQKGEGKASLDDSENRSCMPKTYMSAHSL